MISALVHVPAPGGDDALEALADTLAALVEGVAAGLVGDAVVIVPAADPDVAAVADATGAALVIARERPWHAGAAVARRQWLFCLAAGDVPGEGWVRAVDRFVGTARAEPVLGRLRRHDAFLARLAARLGPAAPRAGDVVRRDHLRGESRLRIRRLGVGLDRR